MKQWLFNPFIYIAGSKSLVLGWTIMVLTALVGFYSHTHFDGAIDMHVGKANPIHIYLIEQVINWASLVLVLFTAGKVFSRSAIRLIDVAGTLALARWPAFISAIIGFGIKVPHTGTVASLVAGITPAIIILSFISVVFMIWMIVLMYNAFSISCNIKGGKAVGVFMGGLVIAEILSKLALSKFY